ncbi:MULTISPECIES: hypothetical protein [Ralstonia solanacearum species complex]|nr:hypothetical protein [Ralstonia solanacearum]ALF88952.1 hypothetical protein RSUY_26310 [Ralstonia solanacearum]ATI28360.1 hypothetical protein CCY86_13145 [Ralstonia solanacearum]ATJ87116.1 hypothetical protein CDC59_13070 [Ralstonia solanacearum]EAP74140.1 Hypothetical Protein RRSL_03855 [Ralstonia solanacearum UW551]KEI30872.1 hypothetical protein CQ06_03235 [Ralstonia solanacearum]
MTLRSLVNALLGRMQEEPSAVPAQQVAVASRLSQQFELPAQWVLQQENERIAIFRNEVGDVLTVNYFMAVPDIEASIDDVDALRAFYRRTAEANGLALIETELAQLTTLRAVRTLFKARMNQIRGFALIGAYTLPFADRSYVIKVESMEQGVTGMREAVVMALMGPPQIHEATGELIGWGQDPYDPSHRAEFMRNQADDQKFDAQFPDHPLSKVRRYLVELESSVQADSSIRGLQPFSYPAQGH